MADAHRSNWARLGTGIVVAFVIFFVAANRDDLPDAWRAARDSDKLWLAGGLLCMVGFLSAYVGMHWGARHAAHVHSEPSRLVLCALAGNFLNMVTKSGGFAGLAPFVGEAKRRGQPSGPAGTAYVLALMIGDVGLALLIPFALIAASGDGQLRFVHILAALVFGAYIALRAAVLIVGGRDRERARRLATWPGRTWAKLRRRAYDDSDIDHSTVDDIVDAVQVVRGRLGATLPGLVCAVVMQLFGVGMLLCVLQALGVHKSLTVPFVGFVISMLFQIVGIFPGGLGFVEVSLGAVLIAYGINGATASTAVVLYRLLQLWFPIAIGAICGRLLKRGVPARVASPLPADSSR
jgi:uncharacterized protein (TIRG00374 family)